jgi:DNA polymerase III subunit epsilon
MGRGAARVCGIDIETTGLDHANDHVTEIAWVIKDIGDPKPLEVQSHFVLPPDGMLDSSEYLKPNIQQLTKIKMTHLQNGKSLEDIFRWLSDALHTHDVDFVVAHNGENFDKPFLQAKAQDFSPEQVTKVFTRPWLDTSVDCVYPEDCRYTNLMYVAAYFGFINPFPHSALFDVMTMLKVLEQFDVLKVSERAKHPWVVVKAQVDYDRRELAKARRYYWETFGAEKYPKQWVKKIKECDLEKERTEAPFEVVKIA